MVVPGFSDLHYGPPPDLYDCFRFPKEWSYKAGTVVL